MSEDNYREASFPCFPWFPPGNYFPATKINFNLFQQTQMNTNPGIDAAPIRSIAPIFEPAKKSEFETNPSKDKKKKCSAKSSNQYAPKVLRPKQLKKNCPAPKKAKKQTNPGANAVSKNLDAVFGGARMDISRLPPPFCSCTGVARGCYRWGTGGWQSSCCNSIISEYPLPMSSSRPGARMAGRKMSNGAYGKLINKLVAEGYDLSPIDLKNHWAKHGTNKYVTIK